MVIQSPPNGVPWPDEFSPIAKKEKAEYGLQAAQAMFFSKNRWGYRQFDEINEVNALMELAQGRASLDRIYRMFGAFNDKGATQEDDGSLAYIDIQCLNLVQGYINRTVAKLQKYQYDINFSAVDVASVDEAKRRSTQIKAVYELKDFYQNLNIDPQQFYPDIDIKGLPQHPDELLFNMSANPKIKKIVDAEKTMRLVNHTLNDTPQVQRQCDWDDAVVGRMHAHCYLDENMMPRVKWISTKYWGGSYVQNEDFSKQEYAFFIDFISRNQFKTEAQDKLSKDDIEKVLGQYAFPNVAASMGTLPQNYENYDGLEYIPVMRFYFLSNDHVAYKLWNHKETGNRLMDTTHYNYFPSSESKQDAKVVQNSYTSVYGGAWVVDSDIVYDYGRKPIPRTNLVNARLPIITFAPNMKEGRVVSMTAQLVEPAMMLNVAWNRLKDILAKGFMGIIEADLGVLEGLALGKGGVVWKPQEAINFALQSRIWVKRQTTNPFGQSNGPSLEEKKAGLTVADYLNTITLSIQMMDRISGTSAVEQSELPNRLTSGVAKASVVSGNDALEYLINGRQQFYKQICHMMMLLTQEAKRNGAAVQGLLPALGRSAAEYFEMPDELAYCDLGLQMVPEPSQEEWVAFYMEVAAAVQANPPRLNASDSAFIREVRNLTEARYIMAIREQINEDKMMKIRAQDQQFQKEMAMGASKASLQAEMALQGNEGQVTMEIMKLQAQIDAIKQQQQAQFDHELNAVTGTVKSQSERQKGIDSVLKEAMRSKSEDTKSSNKLKGDVIKSQTQLTVAAMNAEAKMKEKAKQPVKK